MENDFMSRAIELSTENVRTGRGGPFAAVIAKGGQILAEGVNGVTARNDPTAHAEIVAIRAACRAIGNFDLSGCAIYATGEPCPMCLGAIYWARLARVYFGSTAADAATAGFDDSSIYQELLLPHAERRIPMIPLMRDQALAALRAWEASPIKIPY
ncbi:MAG TPA: nucleoside deaminase [Candidatus Polarisedimenticolia bacterium]|nr:nucleoside deaminase [Candidatus Polarisedimenticolia bacterium]